jgi:phosphoribosylanthranilate isomerase
MAIAAGADALGLVGEIRPPTGPGVIENDVVREIAEIVPPPVSSFLLTSRSEADDIVDHVTYCRTSAVQLVRHIDPAQYPSLIRSIPAIRRIQVIHVEDKTALDLLNSYEHHVHAFLLDSGRPTAKEGSLGGTGNTHDWEISAEFVRKSRKPVFLAGGLGPENVIDAIRTVRPYGIDLCTGIRTNGRLDERKLGRFMDAVHSA